MQTQETTICENRQPVNQHNTYSIDVSVDDNGDDELEDFYGELEDFYNTGNDNGTVPTSTTTYYYNIDEYCYNIDGYY